MIRKLEARNLAISAGQLSLDIPILSIMQNETHCLIGRSGSGKSLLAAAFAGVKIPGISMKGEILLDGTASTTPNWKNEVFLLPQEPAIALDPTMQVGKQISEIFRWRLSADCPWPDSEAVAREVGLETTDLSRFPSELSGGMQQRIMIAMALAARASFVVADEPTKGLDTFNKRRVITLFNKLKALGRGLILITHDLDIVKALADTVSVIDNGQIVEQGLTENVLSKPQSIAARNLIENQPARWSASPATVTIAAPPVIALSNITFGFTKTRYLFEKLSLKISRGEIMGLYGPSGIGKSTLGDLCLRLRSPSSGSVSWHGSEATSVEVGRHRAKFQKLFQNPVTAFPPNLKLETVFSRLTPVSQKNPNNRQEILSELGLDPALLSRRPHQVSGGELQRLSIARVLLGQPDFIVCDEPSSRLDMSVQRQALDMIAAYVRDQSAAALLISHDLEILRKRADWIFELDGNGRLVAITDDQVRDIA